MSRIRGLTARALLVSSIALASFVGTSTNPGVAAATTPAPTRILDTRIGLGAAAGFAGPGRVIQLALPPAASSAGATSVVVNLTATEAQVAGYATMWTCGDSKPATSNVNFVP
jgi:hypothetical protein